MTDGETCGLESLYNEVQNENYKLQNTCNIVTNMTVDVFLKLEIIWNME